MTWSILAFIGCCVLVYILRGLDELRAKIEKVEKYVTKYPTKWDWKLEELGVKEEWDRERGAYIKSVSFKLPYYYVLREDSDFRSFIKSSFFWGGTSAGFDYWLKISEK